MTIIFDQHSRYKSASKAFRSICSNDSASVLDVGSGESCLLGEFLDGFDITYLDPLLHLNPERSENMIADDIFSTELDGRQFDYVVAIDVFEHVPPEKRAEFLERLFSLAKEGIIVSYPCSDDDVAREVDDFVNEVYKSVFEEDYPWLEEHFRYGLPKTSDVSSFFEQKGWSVSMGQNAYAPWLMEFLAYTVCALEIDGLVSSVHRISELFNSKLSNFDDSSPAYRRIIVGTKVPKDNVFASPCEFPRGAASQACLVRKEMLSGMFRFYTEDDPAFRLTHSKVVGQIMERDAEIVRLSKLLSDQSEWAKERDEDVSERDAEIVRLKDLLDKTLTWQEQVEKDVAKRDAEIGRLGKLLDQVSDWKETLENDVAKRDSEIERLNKVLDEVSDWRERLQSNVVVRDTEIERLNTVLEEQTSWNKNLHSDIEVRDAEIKRLNSVLEELSNNISSSVKKEES